MSKLEKRNRNLDVTTVKSIIPPDESRQTNSDIKEKCTRRISIVVTPSMYERLREAADNEHRNLSNFLISVAEEYIKNCKKE